ncbi:MAG TPA: group III truncated hemoglobin [Pseudomonadales bacterium]|jgi:hemoglobin
MSKVKSDSPAVSLPDLDSPQRIREFLDDFYGAILADAVLAPVFLEVAGIDLRVHLGHIQAYWEKLLLSHDGYHRHTMNIHRALHAKKPLTDAEFDRWLGFFQSTIHANFAGPYADRALLIANHVAANMKEHIVRKPAD